MRIVVGKDENPGQITIPEGISKGLRKKKLSFSLLKLSKAVG